MAARAQYISRAGVKDALEHACQRAPDSSPVEAEDGPAAPSLAAVLRRDVPAVWVGSGCVAAGLSGPAVEVDLHALFKHGVIPESQTPIIKKSVKNPMIGAVLTAPKTVSALLGSQDDAVRDAARTAMDDATQAYIETLERFVRTRTGSQGVMSEAVTGLVGASFEHLSSSAGDPHLHTHILISTAALCNDGKWRTIDSKTLFAAKRIAEAAAMKAIKLSLQRNLRVGDEAFEERLVGSVRTFELKALVGCIEQLSNARRHLESVLSEMGRTLGGQTWGEDLTAWRRHRVDLGSISEKIERETDAAISAGGEPAARMRALWNERTSGRLYKALNALHSVQAAVPAKKPLLDERALEFLESQHSWTHADLTAFLIPESRTPEAAYVRAGVMMKVWAEAGLISDARDVEASVRAIIDGRPIETRIIHESIGLHAKQTTAAAIFREKRLFESAATLSKTPGIALSIRPDETWSDEQRHAVRIIGQGRRLSVITGVAGAGKTTIAAPCATAARACGMQVISIARNAARAIETGDGIKAHKSMSVAAFLQQDIERIGRNRPMLLMVDEAAVIDRKDWEKILEKADKGRIQIVAFGDRKQAQSIDKKGSFSIIEQAARAAGSASVLTKSYRNQLWETEATAIRNGNANEVLAMAEGRISKVQAAGFANDVAARIAAEPGSIAIVMTNAEASQISRAVQASRGIKVEFPISQSSYVGIGDRIRTRKNDHKSGIFNGNRWIVEHITNEGLTAKNESGKSVFLSKEYCGESVELDYAATLDSAQGITVEKAVVVISPTMGNSQLYSAATRGRFAPAYVVADDSNTTPERILSAVIERQDLALTAVEIAGENHARRIIESAGCSFDDWSNFFKAAQVEMNPAPIPPPITASSIVPRPVPDPPRPVFKPPQPPEPAAPDWPPRPRF